jgi:hypothetical protein
VHNGIVSEAPKPGTGPLRPKVGRMARADAGGFHALESWLYDHDFIDLERRRASFLGSRRTSTWIPATKVAVTRSVPHTPAGTPTLIREVGRRQIHVSEASRISGEYRHINEKAAHMDGLPKTSH